MASSKRAIYASIAGDLAVAATKFGAALLTSSSAMLSEGIHSVVDAANGALLLVGLKRAQRPPDLAHPFGHGQELYFWTLIVAVMIFGLGGGVSTYEGIVHLLRPHPLQHSLWNYLVLGAAFLFQGAASLVALRDFRRMIGEEGVLESAIESKDPTMFAVVFEDAAAMAGLVIAFLGLVIGQWLGSPAPDAVASIVIGLLLAAVAIFLVHETRSLLAGESADPDMVQAIRALTEGDPAVRSVWPPLTIYFGPHFVLLNLDIQFLPALTAAEVARAVERIERGIRARFPIVRQIFIEARAISEPGAPPASPGEQKATRSG
ncbi:MAG TPA: cation diffusion facilitator family transporter [Longimicrobiales bacterium]